MAQIIPITELRNTGEISALCSTTDEPIFITKNGYGDMVIMSNVAYEKKTALAEIYRKLLLGQRQIDSGDMVDGDEVFGKLRDKYDF